jgi:hypothetical protein
LGIKDKGNDVVELRRAGCRLLNVDTNQTFYRIAGGAANASATTREWCWCRAGSTPT